MTDRIADLASRIPSRTPAARVRAAINALGLDVLDFKDIQRVTIDPHAIEVVMVNRNEDGKVVASANGIATFTASIPINWAPETEQP